MTPPLSLFLLGASRGTGLEVAKLARSRGHQVFTMIRTPSQTLEDLGVIPFIGDALDKARTAEVYRMCPGVDAVISTLGGSPDCPSPDYTGIVNLVDSISASGKTPRLLLTSSLGAGESRAYASERLLAALGTILEEKTKAEAYVAASGLPYTIIRPGRLLDQQATHTATLSTDPSLHGSLSRADLAELILATLGDPDSIGQTYSAIDPAI